MVKKSRFFGIFGGIISLILTFISKITIPLTADFEVNFNLFKLINVEFYYWGYVVNENVANTSMLKLFPENVVAFFIWICIFYVGISSIMASTKKAKKTNSLKIFKINILLIGVLLFIFGSLIVISHVQNLLSALLTIGLGYYLTILLMVLNSLAKHYLKKE